MPVLFLPVHSGAVAASAQLCGLAFLPQLTLRPQAFLVSRFSADPRPAPCPRPACPFSHSGLWANLHGLYEIRLGIFAVFTAL